MKWEIELSDLTAREREELREMRILSPEGTILTYVPPPRREGYRAVTALPISAPDVLNEAHAYPVPSSFSRGLRVDLPDYSMLYISGTASVDESGATVHAGDFRAQCWRTYRNITRLIESEGATWSDVVRLTCYLRDIERDYFAFNQVRTTFFRWLRLNPLPASTGIQARLCRDDLLIEMEAIAILLRDKRT
jgi:enamine deaminase RidA (YjgF/YER057c/UK114 family)